MKYILSAIGGMLFGLGIMAFITEGEVFIGIFLVVVGLCLFWLAMKVAGR